MSSGTVIELRFLRNMLRICQLAYKPLCVRLCFLYLYGLLYVVFSPANEEPEDLRLEWCVGYVYTQKNTHEDLLGIVLAAEVERKAHKIALISI